MNLNEPRPALQSLPAFIGELRMSDRNGTGIKSPLNVTECFARASNHRWVFTVFMISAIAVSLITPALAQQRKVLDRIVANIGGEVITQSDLELATAQAAIQNRMNPADTTIRRRVLEAMIVDKLILAAAQLDSVVVGEDEVTQALEQQIQYLERNYGSRERLEQAAGMPLSRIKREFREDIKNRLMIDRFKQMKFGEIQLSRREVEEFFTSYKDSLSQVPEQIEMRQIAMFPKVTELYKSHARKRAEALLDSLKNGADFSELAKKYSEDVGSARIGGDLGLVRRGIFVKEFEEAAYALDPGQTSGIVETQFGFHIIKLLEKKGEAVRPKHILIRITKTGESDSAVITTLTSVRDRILKGEKFEDLARQYSEDVDTKSFGGSLGIVEVPRLSDELHQAEQTLKEGEITPPIKLKVGNEFAYTIVQLQKRIQPHAMSIEADYVRIEQIAKVMKQNKLYAQWIDTIKKTIYYEIKL